MKRTFQPFNLSTCAALAVAALCAANARAGHIKETMTLAKGWNAIYLESTPTNAACADFFAGAPVERVASYHSDAYSSTRQIADDGTAIDQKPISYRVWVPGDEAASTMTSLAGGRVYLIYATADWTSDEFLGVPAAPRQTWRATSGDTGFVNLAGVSADAGETVTARAYFGEGPFGAASGVAYRIAGTGTAAPSFLSLGLAGGQKLQGGRAYALTAAKDGDWPGVIGFLGVESVDFGTGDFASVTLRNCGTTTHVFRVSIVPSADLRERILPMNRQTKDEHGDESWTSATNAPWEVELAPGSLGVQRFSIDRAAMAAGETCAAVMQIEDLGPTRMRVRIPVTVEEKPADEAAFPAGLWAGFVQMEAVSSLTNETPTAAAGTLKMNILVHVAEDGTAQLLQRVAAGVDAAGRLRLFRELSAARAACENPRRFSTVMMSVDTPAVGASAYTTFGDQVQFDWTVDAKARDNPFRHAWHPDHDGLTADYAGDVVSGDDLANYANPVKPELWSVTNTLHLSWHKLNNPTEGVDFEHNPEETTAGYATWTVGGLVSGGPIKSMGVFFLKRIAEVGEIEP